MYQILPCASKIEQKLRKKHLEQVRKKLGLSDFELQIINLEQDLQNELKQGGKSKDFQSRSIFE